MLNIETPATPAKPRKAKRPSFAARLYPEKLRDDRTGAVADVRPLQHELRGAMQLVAQLDECIVSREVANKSRVNPFWGRGR